jgi:hypothetical protein
VETGVRFWRFAKMAWRAKEKSEGVVLLGLEDGLYSSSSGDGGSMMRAGARAA